MSVHESSQSYLRIKEWPISFQAPPSGHGPGLKEVTVTASATHTLYHCKVQTMKATQDNNNYYVFHLEVFSK